MKALLIADNESLVKVMSQCIISSGFDIIHYRSAVKALDNIGEIEPDAIFISAVDFPRHWKTLVQFVRADTIRGDILIVLLVNERFSTDDAHKANFIGVQAILNEKLDSCEDTEILKKMFSRYGIVSTNKIINTDILSEKALFMFTNPLNDTIITGKIENITESDLRFRPDAPSATANLASKAILEQCSLKIDKKILSPRCKIVSNNTIITLEFIEKSEELSKTLHDFINDLLQTSK